MPPETATSDPPFRRNFGRLVLAPIFATKYSLVTRCFAKKKENTIVDGEKEEITEVGDD